VSVEVENDDDDALDSTATIPRPPSSAFVLGYTWRRSGDNAAENDLSFLNEQVIISSTYLSRTSIDVSDCFIRNRLPRIEQEEFCL